MTTQTNARWQTIAAVAAVIVVLAGATVGYLMQSSAQSADVRNLKAELSKLDSKMEKRISEMATLQFNDGRDLTALKASVEAIQKDVTEIKTMIREIHRARSGGGNGGRR